MGITTPNNYPEIPTFYHHDNKSKSQIDYLLNVESQANEGIDSIRIMEHQSINTSDHVLTTGIINIMDGTKTTNKRQSTNQYCKPKWPKCDDTLYRSSISNYLDSQSECHNDNTKFQVVLDVLHQTYVLHSATGNAIPNHKNLRTGRAKRKGKALWNEEIGQASKHVKQHFIIGKLKEQ